MRILRTIPVLLFCRCLAAADLTRLRDLETGCEIRLELGGKTVELKDLAVRPPLTEFRYEDGSIGMDALAGGFILDFRAMQLRLE